MTFFRSSRFRALALVAWHVLAVLGAIVAPPTVSLAALAVVVYVVGMFGITAGYHRYFSHRSFRTSRAGQVALAVLAEATLQKGVLWWAARHRHHHAYADREEDLHSPSRRGFWHAHVGWIVTEEGTTRDDSLIRDLTSFPELRWLDRNFYAPPFALAVVLMLAGGLPALVWGFAIPLLALQQATYLINSLAHIWGDRPYATRDTSRNNALLAILTLGEGWHNNHHFFPSSSRQGFLWWQFDPTWYALRVLASLGLVWDLKTPPARILAARHAG